MSLTSSGLRAGRLLRWAGALESQTQLASRSFSSSSPIGLNADGAAGASSDALAAYGTVAAAAVVGWPEAGAASAAAADLLPAASSAAEGLASAAGGAAVGSSEVGSVLGVAMAAVDGLHATTGLPWWATISAVGVLARATMLPVSLQGMRASAALMPLLRQAREEAAASLLPPPSAAAAAGSEKAAAAEQRRDKQQRWQRAQQRQQQQAAATAAAAAMPEQQRAAQQQQQRHRVPTNAQILARFQELRRAAGAPHPIWVLTSPLAQLPVFMTAMAAIRTMSLNSWPGFSSGGTAWFTDLTLPAMNLADMVAPLGMAGVVLPLGITLSMLANIDAAFTVPAGSSQQASVILWLMGSLRLFLEWMMVPLFAITLQLPHGALCYWATSSGLALAQNHALKQPAVRRLVGLPTGAPPQQPEAGQQPMPVPPTREAAAGAAAAVAAGAAGPLPAGVDPQLRQFLLTTSDQGALFDRASALRAQGRAGASSAVLNRLLQLYPGQPNALYALGQVHAALKDWALSEQYFLQAAQHKQLDAQSRSRSWFGAAVAMHMQQEHDTAIDAFKRAADVAQTDELRVRSWVSQATLHRKLGQFEAAVKLLRKAARAEPKVEEAYLKPLLAEMAAGQQIEGHSQHPRQQQQQRQEEAPLQQEVEDFEAEQQVNSGLPSKK